MGPLGVPEMLFILVLILLIFGPKRLPEVGRMVGKGLGEFRRALDDSPAVWFSVLRVLSNEVNAVYDDMRVMATR